MAKAKTKKAKRRHSFLLTVCFISLAIVFVICLISLKKNLRQKNEDLSQLQSQYDELNAENEELQKLKDNGVKITSSTQNSENGSGNVSSYETASTTSSSVSGEQEKTTKDKKKEYMEKVARENGYIKPGDRVYQDIAAGE